MIVCKDKNVHKYKIPHTNIVNAARMENMHTHLFKEPPAGVSFWVLTTMADFQQEKAKPKIQQKREILFWQMQSLNRE